MRVRTTSCSVSEKRSPRALKTPGAGGIEHLSDLQRAGDLDPGQRAVPTEGAEREVPRITAAVGGDSLDRTGHRRDREHQNAVGGLLDRAAERCRDDAVERVSAFAAVNVIAPPPS